MHRERGGVEDVGVIYCVSFCTDSFKRRKMVEFSEVSGTIFVLTEFYTVGTYTSSVFSMVTLSQFVRRAKGSGEDN